MGRLCNCCRSWCGYCHDLRTYVETLNEQKGPNAQNVNYININRNNNGNQFPNKPWTIDTTYRPIADTMSEYSPMAYFETSAARARHFRACRPDYQLQTPKWHEPKTITSLCLGRLTPAWIGPMTALTDLPDIQTPSAPPIPPGNKDNKRGPCILQPLREMTPIERQRALRPSIKDDHHQDSLFGNSFQSKSFFVVHPEWLSEAVDNTDPEPLHRPPWPWEQPRYRQNIQTPITYKPQEAEPLPEHPEQPEESNGLVAELTPMGYECPRPQPIGYRFTHPSIDDTKPFAKTTQFGAPVVDTSVYKLG